MHDNTFNNLSIYPLSNEEMDQIMLEKMYDNNKLLIDHKSLKPHQTMIDKQPLILQLPTESEQNINAIKNEQNELYKSKIAIPNMLFEINDDKYDKKNSLRFFLLIIIILICAKSIYNIINYESVIKNINNNQINT